MTDFIARSNKGSWDFYCWRWISSCNEWVCAETQAALLPRDRGREGERKRERGRDCTYSIQKEVEKEFERREREEAECDSTEREEEEEEEEEGPSGRDKGGRNREGDELRVSEGREHQKVDEREKARGKLWESGEERGEQEKEDSSANQPRSDPLTAAVIQAGRGSLAQQEGKKKKKHMRNSFFFFIFWIYLSGRRHQKTPWRGEARRRKRNQRASAASECPPAGEDGFRLRRAEWRRPLSR